MGSKRKGGVCNLNSSSESGDGRKISFRQTFRIHSSRTESNREKRKKAATEISITLDETTSERKIRDILTGKLPRLRGKSFKFFTKDKAGIWYFCPCSPACEGKNHSAESWNGSNILRAAESNSRDVYILIESTTTEPTRSGGVQNDPTTNPVGQYSTTMVSKRKGGSGSRNGRKWQTFRIHSSGFLTESDRDERKNAATKILLDVTTSEREIRDILIRELPRLRGKIFRFFTKDKERNWYFCPCSPKCGKKKHSVEWNGSNIQRVANSNRAVYILIESSTTEPTRSGGVQNDPPTNPVPSDPQFRASVGQYSSNPWNQNQVRVVVKNEQSVNCSDMPHQENTTVFSHGNHLNQWLTQEPAESAQMNGTSTGGTTGQDSSGYNTLEAESTRDPLAIEEIIPPKGSVKGGYSFVLCFAEPCMVDQCKVRFGNAVPVPYRKRGNDCRGKVPPYPTPGEVQVQLESPSGVPMSDTVTFNYTNESATSKCENRPQDIQTLDPYDWLWCFK